MKNTNLILPVISLIFLISCGSTGGSLIKDDQGLLLALGDAEYASLTDAEKYDAADFLIRSGDLVSARSMYEDIVTHNRKAVTVKFKLAMMYLDSEQVGFLKKDEKGRLVTFSLNGRELGEKVLREIAEQNPWYLPVYSQLMILEAGRGSVSGVKQWYEKARALNPDYATSDYRVAVLTMSDSSRVEEGKKLLIKGQATYADLYQSYKKLGTIQKVQHLDTIAIETLGKAARTKTEAVDLFSTYYDMAIVSARLYKQKNDENYKTQAIQYGCMSVMYFPKYKPALLLVKDLAGLQVPGDSANISLEAYQATVGEYAKTLIPENEQIQMSTSEETVIPESLLLDEWAARQKHAGKKKPGSNNDALLIGGGIVVGAGAIAVALTMGGGKSTKNSFGTPPAFPAPN